MSCVIIHRERGAYMKSLYWRIIDQKEWFRLHEETEAMDDPVERSAREALLEGIMNAITDYDVHVREYAFRQSVQELLNRGITLEPADRATILSQWDSDFDGQVSPAAKATARHYTNQFRWHLFSFELLPALTGEEARAAFDRQPRQELYIFFDCAPECFRVKNAQLLCSADVEALRENSSLNHSDLYFYDPANHWTYVRPHEDYCGPYFCSPA